MTTLSSTPKSDLATVPVEMNPMVLIQSGLASNAGVETMERLFALQERYDANLARAAFNQAMAKAQGEMPVVVKDKVNKHTGVRYASIEATQEKIKPIYLANGFTCTFAEDGAPVDGMIHVIGVVRHVAGHTETYHRYGPADSEGAKGVANKTAIQGAQSSVSYLSRRLMCSIFGVTVADEDTDGGTADPVITGGQLKEIHALLIEAKRDIPAFLALHEVDSLPELPQSKYREFVQAARLMKATSQKREAAK